MDQSLLSTMYLMMAVESLSVHFVGDALIAANFAMTLSSYFVDAADGECTVCLNLSVPFQRLASKYIRPVHNFVPVKFNEINNLSK